MQKDAKSVNCNIGGNLVLDDEWGAISLVRRLGQEHSFLVLERYEEGGIRSKVAHLTYKEKTNETKAIIKYDSMSNASLEKLAAKCHSITWPVSKAQMEAFEIMMEVETALGEAGKIDYVMMGQSQAGGLLAASLESSLPESSVEASTEAIVAKRKQLQDKLAAVSEKTASKLDQLTALKYLTISFIEMLLRDGDNCVTWSISMLQSIGINMRASKFNPILFANPKAILEGNLDGEVEEREHTSSCSMM